MVSATHRGPSVSFRTAANAVTVARICLAPVLFYLILAADGTGGTSWSVLALGIVLGASDWIDGRLARGMGAVSRGGAFLDPLADKVVVLGAAFCFVIVGRYWWLPVALMAVREVAVSLLRVRFARQGLSVPATRAAKWKTTAQAVALTVAALPPLEHADALVTGLLWAATALTLLTGWQYFRAGSSLASATGAAPR